MGADEFDDNPRLSLPSWVWAMIPLWRMYRGGGFGGGILPDPGGSIDQSILMMSCFQAMSAADSAFEAAEKGAT